MVVQCVRQYNPRELIFVLKLTDADFDALELTADEQELFTQCERKDAAQSTVWRGIEMIVRKLAKPQDRG